MSLPRVTLQSLDAFERVARSGSVQVAAQEMGLSISSVSHQIARLEAQMGAVLFDRSSRPFTLTREGGQAFHHLSKGLFHLRRATSEAAMSGLLGARSLRIGIVEDFESNVTPELAVVLARQMPQAALSIRTILSHETANLVRKGEIDVAVSSTALDVHLDMSNIPILHDPFVLAAPKGMSIEPESLLSGQTELPFIRFNRQHMIGQQIEGHLKRNRVDLAERFSFDSVQSIMAVIAEGEGWSVITPLGFMRAKRFVDRVHLYPLSIPTFWRNISVAARSDFDVKTLQAVASLVRSLVARQVIEPSCAICPWLTDTLALIPSEE